MRQGAPYILELRAPAKSHLSISSPVPDGYHTVTPYLFVHGVDGFIHFLKQAFESSERMRIKGPDDNIGHAEVQIGDSVIMMAEASDKWKPNPTGLHLYVRDVDATYQRALKAGATSVMDPSDQAHGDLMGGVEDPFGNHWWIATRNESVSPQETERRWKAGRPAEVTVQDMPSE